MSWMISSDGEHSFPDVFMAIKRSLLIHYLFNLQFIIELVMFVGTSSVWGRGGVALV